MFPTVCSRGKLMGSAVVEGYCSVETKIETRSYMFD